MIEYVTITHVDQAAGTVDGISDAGPFVDQVFLGDAPPPLSRCAADRSGSKLRILGPLGDRRVLLHDDFLVVDSVLGYGDTPWRAAGTVGTINTATGIDAVGHVRIRGNPVSGQEVWLTKTNENITVPNDAALWMSARFDLTGATLARYRVGLANDLAANDVTPGIASGAGVYLSMDTARGAAFELIATVGTGASNTLLPDAYANGAFYTVDFCVFGDEWAACWLDGDGPYVIEGANVPGPADPGVAPILYVEALEAAAKIMRVDWVHIEEFIPAMRPQDV